MTVQMVLRQSQNQARVQLPPLLKRPLPDGMITLRQWAQQIDRTPSTVMTRWRQKPGFPSPIGQLPTESRRRNVTGESPISKPSLTPGAWLKSASVEQENANYITPGKASCTASAVLPIACIAILAGIVVPRIFFLVVIGCRLITIWSGPYVFPSSGPHLTDHSAGHREQEAAVPGRLAAPLPVRAADLVPDGALSRRRTTSTRPSGSATGTRRAGGPRRRGSSPASCTSTTASC